MFRLFCVFILIDYSKVNILLKRIIFTIIIKEKTGNRDIFEI